MLCLGYGSFGTRFERFLRAAEFAPVYMNPEATPEELATVREHLTRWIVSQTLFWGSAEAT